MDYQRIKKIFRKSSKNDKCIATQEGYKVEYKQNFRWGSFAEYAKAMAAMANHQGGHIVFGIKDKPHELLGIDAKAIQQFTERDLSKWSAILREYFEPSIRFERELFEFEGKTYAIIEVLEAEEKPIICKKYVDGKIRMGAIYYRYKAENTEIQYAELKAIIDHEKNKINDFWIQRIQQISLAGVTNTMILNTNTGLLQGANGGLYIGSELLKEIRFVDKGTFVEQGGEPVLSIIGEVKSVKDAPIPVSIREKEVALSDSRIIEIFLNREHLDTGREHIAYMLNSSSRNFPIFYFLKATVKNGENYEEVINDIVGFKDSVEKISDRITSDRLVYKVVLKNTGTEAYKNKVAYKEKILREEDISTEDTKLLKYGLSAIRSLEPEEIVTHQEYLFSTLLNIFKNFYVDADTNLRAELKKAACYIDEILYSSRQFGS